MGKKKQDQLLMQQLLAAINQANQPTQFETQLTGEYNNLTNFLNSRDYRNLPTGVNVNLLPLADYQKMRTMQRGSDAGAQRAAGANFAPMVQAQRELGDNEFVQDWGGAYETAVGDLNNQKYNLAQTLQGYQTNRQNANVGNQAMYLDAWRNRPKNNFWGDMFKGLLQTGAQAAVSMI